MGNCNCLERARAKVTAWGDGEDEFLGATSAAELSGGGAQRVLSTRKEIKGGGGGEGTGSPTRRVKIRMTKGQLRRLLDGAGRGAAVEDVVADIMRMGDVYVEPVKAEDGHRPPAPPSKLETIQEDMDE